MAKHYEDEILPSGTRLRFYFKGKDFGFPNEYFSGMSDRYPDRGSAIAALAVAKRRAREDEIRYTFSGLGWADFEDLQKCPECFGVVTKFDVLEHYEWHRKPAN